MNYWTDITSNRVLVDVFFFFFGGDFHHRPFLSSTDIQKFVFFLGAGVFRGSQLLNIVASKDSNMFFFTWFPFLNFSVPQLQGVGTFCFFFWTVAFPNGCGTEPCFFFQTPWVNEATKLLTSLFISCGLPVPETNSKLAPLKMNGWKMIPLYFQGASFSLFSGALAVFRSFLGSVVRETFHLSWWITVVFP